MISPPTAARAAVVHACHRFGVHLGVVDRRQQGLQVRRARCVRRSMDAVRSSDITYIATDEGWLYLAVVIDLFSRQVVGLVEKPSLNEWNGLPRSQ